MAAPPLYLVAYDVSDPRRLQRVGKAVGAWKAAGQKSVAECWLKGSSRDRLMATLAELMDSRADRLLILRLDPRMEPRLFGSASRPGRDHFIVT